MRLHVLVNSHLGDRPSIEHSEKLWNMKEKSGTRHSLKTFLSEMARGIAKTEEISSQLDTDIALSLK
jgi:hypothetical protein